MVAFARVGENALRAVERKAGVDHRHDLLGGVAVVGVIQNGIGRGGTALVREWGSIGSPGRVRDDHYPDDEAAIVAAASLERSKRRRGYA
jgi:WGR domain